MFCTSKIMLLGLIFFLFITNTNNLCSQLRNQWVVVDSIGYSILNVSYADIDNIVTITSKSIVYDIDSGMISELIIRRTNDGGNSWKTIYSDTSTHERWESVAYPSKDKIIITGQKEEVLYKGKYQDYYKEYGLLILSNDSGKTWSRTYLDSNSRLWYMSMLDVQYGIAYKLALGNYFNRDAYHKNDSILITEDGWQTWNAIPIPYETKGKIGQLIFISQNVFKFLLVDYYNFKSYVYTTEDGGLNWTISDAIPSRMRKMKFIDKNTGWVIGTLDTIYKTTNDGETWSYQYNIEPGNTFMGLIDIDFADKVNGIAIGSSAFIINTNDGGENWYREFVPSNMTNGRGLKRIVYPSLDAAYVFVDNYIIKRTDKKILKAPSIKRKIFANPAPIAGNILEWNKIEGADHYELIMYESSLDSFIQSFKYVSATVVSDTNLELVPLKYSMEYLFKIRAFNDTISSEWNQDSQTLKTLRHEYDIPVPVILYPEPNSDTHFPMEMTIRWTSKEKVDGYDLEFYETEGESRILSISETDLKDTSYHLDSLVPDKKYILYVRSKRNDTLSGWAYSFFTIMPATDVSEPTNPKQENIIQQIIPNPVSDRCIIRFNDEPFNLTSLKLYNSIGVELADLTRAVQFQYGNNELKLNLSTLSNGIYFIVVRHRHGIDSKSFVIIR